VSVWARKNAFLWAILPISALELMEGLLLHSSHVARFIGHRFGGVFEVIGFGDPRQVESLSDFAAGAGRVFTNYETWLGVLAAAALLFAVIRIRRYRDDA